MRESGQIPPRKSRGGLLKRNRREVVGSDDSIRGQVRDVAEPVGERPVDTQQGQADALLASVPDAVSVEETVGDLPEEGRANPLLTIRQWYESIAETASRFVNLLSPSVIHEPAVMLLARLQAFGILAEQEIKWIDDMSASLAAEEDVSPPADVVQDLPVLPEAD